MFKSSEVHRDLAVISFIPHSKLPEPLPYSNLRAENVIALQAITICISNRNIAGLHADELTMAFEVVIFGQDTCANEFLLKVSMQIPSGLIPYCPVCGEPMTMNLRADDTFVEDEGWRRASAAYAAFLNDHRGGRVLYLELGVGANTPVIIKYPFWQESYANENSFYACINYGEAFCPKEIEDRSVCIDGDIGDVIGVI